MSALLKIPLIVVPWVGYMVGMTAPTPPADSPERDGFVKLGIMERMIQSSASLLCTILKTFVSTIMITEIMFVLADTQNLSGTKNWLCSHAPSAHTFISPVFMLGVLVGGVGGLVRVACYRELGRFHTYELSIRNEHKLVTSGPYGVVRHPSYTGIILIATGFTLCELAPGSWWMESHVFDGAIGKSLAFAWLVCLYVKLSVILRAPREDVMLKKTFGKQWEEYARRVRCMYLPGLL